MSTSQKLIQLYTSENKKEAFKTYTDSHYKGRMKSMSKILWQMTEVLIALEDEMNFDEIHDETSFKREFITAVENSQRKREVINFHIDD